MDTIKVEAGDDIAAIVKAFGAQLPNPTNSLSLLARFGVRESDLETIKSAFAHSRSQTLAEPGCEIFELNEDAQNTGGFVVYERWRSLADLEAHLRKDHTIELRTLFHRLIIDGPEFQVLLPAES
jgi:quinol monooxygenase YgiN